jgi:hypothetical protein
MRHRAPETLWLAFALCITSAPALAQKGDSKLMGRVTDKSTGRPVPTAQIIYRADGRSVVADSAGQYQFPDLPPGLLRFVVRAEGFPLATVIVALTKAESMTRMIELDSTPVGRSAAAQALPKVDVSAPASRGPRYLDFERRQHTGRGQYLTREDIERSGASSLQDAVRSLRGVNVECGGGLGCFIRMVRAPMQCLPEYIIDEQVNNTFGAQTPIRDIEAIEVYTGPSDVPGEFAGRNAGCGVIVIWTKAGPSRRKP